MLKLGRQVETRQQLHSPGGTHHPSNTTSLFSRYHVMQSTGTVNTSIVLQGKGKANALWTNAANMNISLVNMNIQKKYLNIMCMHIIVLHILEYWSTVYSTSYSRSLVDCVQYLIYLSTGRLCTVLHILEHWSTGRLYTVLHILEHCSTVYSAWCSKALVDCVQYFIF